MPGMKPGCVPDTTLRVSSGCHQDVMGCKNYMSRGAIGE
tara:strand:- start:479 stop:595 length:117 start_codon:yes stop_codon:yes gene_type:complete